MNQRFAYSVGLVAAGVVLTLAGTAHATVNLDPFKPRATAPASDPVRVVGQSAQATDSSDAPSSPAPAAQVPAPAGSLSCKTDEQCPADTICEEGFCRGFERRISVLLFQKEGPATKLIPFYWARRGVPGYRVVFPFYWHFWSAEDNSRIITPFYWRFEDYLKQRVVTVVVPYVHTIQPDAESWAIWPLFYRSTKFGWAAPLLASFKLETPADNRSLGLYGLLYFWKRSPTSAFDLGFPLFVSKRSTDSAFTYALPLNFYWRTQDDKNLLLLPLLYKNWNKISGLAVSPLGYRSTAEGGSSKGSVLWLYWYGRRSDSQYDVLFPLLWSFRSPQSNTTLLPPVLHIRRDAFSFNTVFPLWFSASDQQEGSNWKLLLPLFLTRSRQSGRSSDWLTPLGGGSRDDSGARSVTFLVPPIFYRSDPNREFESYLLLYWRYRDVPGNANTTVVGPFYGRTDPAGSTHVAFPLFWHFRDAASGATARSLFPLYFRRSSPDESLTAAGVFPVWFYYRHFTDGGFSAGLAPFFFFGSRGDKSHAVLFPLLYHVKDERESATVAMPLFYRFADQHHSNAGVPPLLYFQGRDHQDTYHVQIPFFWRFHDGEKDVTTTVVPPVFYRSRPDGWSAGVAPLLFMAGGPQRHFVLFPLFWHLRDDQQDRTTTVVLNYLHRRHGGETTDALFPLFHWRRGARPGGVDETSFTLFPLVHYRRSPASTVFASPLAAWGRNATRKGGFAGPYFWYQSQNIAVRGVPPLYLDVTRLRTGERTRVVGPWIQMDAPAGSARVLFPLFAHYSEKNESGTYVFPTYFQRHTTDGYVLHAFFPLLWLSHAPGKRTTVVGPFFRKTAPDASATGLLPLFVHAQNPHRELLVTPLFVHWGNRDESTTHTVAPLFFRSTHAGEESTVAFPLFWSGKNTERSYAVFLPLYWHFTNKRAETNFNLLGPFLWSRAGDWHTRGIMPVLWYGRDGRGSGTNGFVPVFYESHTPAKNLLLTAAFGFRREPGNNWFYVGPFIYKDSWDKSFWTFFPLVFSHFDKISETHTRVIPPLLFYSQSSPSRALTGMLMVFWHHRDITSSSTLLLPLFYDLHSFHERRLTMFFPLFVRYKNEVTGSSHTFAPLFYRRSSPADSSTVVFPLVWDFRGGDRSSTVVFPFYAGFRRSTWEGRYIFPNIWYRTGLGPEAGTSRLFVFPFWESAVKRPGDYMWEALLGLMGWERIGRNRFLKVLFIPFELSPTPAAQTAWHSKTPPPSRRERAYGLATGAW